ncbi:MAG: D-sedoheptulose-7-phosphate isomerase [Luteolibacter sp.]
MAAPNFKETLSELRDVLDASASLAETVEETGQSIISCLLSGGKILTCGNGGSAADAMHLSEELVGKYSKERRPLPAISLCTDPTALTCIGNDYGYEQIFSRPLEAFGKEGDVLVAFSTSGNSPNILTTLKVAKEAGVITILLTGKDGGVAKELADFALIVPSQNTARIQEVHTLILHQWLELVDSVF